MRIFVTVGNALVPFDRLLRWVDEALLLLSRESPIEGICQHGPSVIRPTGLLATEQLSRQQFEEEMAKADLVICHAGVGTLQEAMRYGHIPIVVPRRAALFEIVNDHHLEIVSALLESNRIFAPENAPALLGLLQAFARGEQKRGPRREPDPARLAVLAQVLEKGPFRAQPSRVGAALLRALAAIGPSVNKLRVR